jgi:hypothetical protein
MTAEQMKKLQDALLAGFNQAELEQLVRFELGEKLSVRVGPGALSDVVFRLIEWAQRTGRGLDLIRAARKANPGNAEIQAVATELLPQPTGPGAAAPHGEHPLHRFPRGCLVPFDLVPTSIIEVYANAYLTPESITAVVNDAIGMRKAADRGDPRLKTIQPGQLLNPGQVPANAYWTHAFIQACRQGPRMVAALLLAAPDDIFGADGRAERDRVLESLATLR